MKEKKTVSLYLEPIACLESPLNATVSFFDAKDRPQAVPMVPKVVKITCPIFFTETDANLARVKRSHRNFAHRDRKLYPIKNIEKASLIFASVISVLSEFDIKLINKEFSDKDLFGEAWFYGITKVKKNQIITYILLDGESRFLEFEVSGNNEDQITAFLAEIGDRVRNEFLINNIITAEDNFYDMRVSVLSQECPYCGDKVPPNLTQKYVDGKSIDCEYCGVKIIRLEK